MSPNDLSANSRSKLASSRHGDSSLTSLGRNTTNDNETEYFETETAIHDLGRERFDHDVAAIGDRDTAFFASGPVNVAKGRAPMGMERQVFAWNTMHYTTEDKDDKEELKGDLHGGQLHRQNRAARAPPPKLDMIGGGGGGGGGGMRRRGGANKAGGIDGGLEESLRAAMKPEHDAPPLAKGFAEELSADMFWSEPIV